MLQVTNLNKTFNVVDGQLTAVNNVTFNVPDGQFASIIGRSGSGKSTLLALLGALDKPTSGSIYVGDWDVTQLSAQDLTKYRGREIGFVFQNYNLVPNLTALENVMLPMGFIRMPAAERRARAKQLLEEVGINAQKQQRKPGKLSGGEQQRVSIARALANKPKLLLADEPTGNLDNETSLKIYDLLRALAKAENTTVVAVTHDLSIAYKTDVTYHLQDGVLMQQNNMEAPKQPQTEIKMPDFQQAVTPDDPMIQTIQPQQAAQVAQPQPAVETFHAEPTIEQQHREVLAEPQVQQPETPDASYQPQQPSDERRSED